MDHINMMVKVKVTQSCPTLFNPMDCSLPGSSVHGIFPARVLEWVAIAFSLKPNYQPVIFSFRTKLPYGKLIVWRNCCAKYFYGENT